jgi:hypothetical protein
MNEGQTSIHRKMAAHAAALDDVRSRRANVRPWVTSGSAAETCTRRSGDASAPKGRRDMDHDTTDITADK